MEKTSKSCRLRRAVSLKSIDGTVSITGVGLRVAGVTPTFDWSTAHFAGLDAFANGLLSRSGLSGSDLSLRVASLNFASGRLVGDLDGRLLDYEFTAPFSIGEKDAKLSLPSVHQAMIDGLQKVLDGRELHFSGLTLSGLRMCPEGANAGDCADNGLILGAKFVIGDVFSGDATLAIHPTLKVKVTGVQSASGFSSLTDLFSVGFVKVDLPTQFNPLVLTGLINIPDVFGVIPIPAVPFQWSSATGKVTLQFPEALPCR